MPQLKFAPQQWAALCQHAALHPTCKLVLHQHQGQICKITVEYDVRPDPPPAEAPRKTIDDTPTQHYP